MLTTQPAQLSYLRKEGGPWNKRNNILIGNNNPSQRYCREEVLPFGSQSGGFHQDSDSRALVVSYSLHTKLHVYNIDLLIHRFVDGYTIVFVLRCGL